MSARMRLVTALWVALTAACLHAAPGEALLLRYHWQVGQRWERRAIETMVLHWPTPGKYSPRATVTQSRVEELRVESASADGVATLALSVRDLRRELLVDGHRKLVHSTTPGEPPATRDAYLRCLLARGVKLAVDSRGQVRGVLNRAGAPWRVVDRGDGVGPSVEAAEACLLAMQHDYLPHWLAVGFVSYPDQPVEPSHPWSVDWGDLARGGQILSPWPNAMTVEWIDAGERLCITARHGSSAFDLGPPAQVVRSYTGNGALHSIDRATGMPLFSTVWMSGSYDLATDASALGPLVHWSASARYLVTPITSPGA